MPHSLIRGQIDLKTIKVVSWDVDGTLYSVQRMKWWIVYLLTREVAAGRGAAAWRDLATLWRYRITIEEVRSRGGEIVDALSAAERRLLLDAQQRWYGRAIARAGARPGVRKVLDWFAAKRIPQVIVSDYDAVFKLELLRLGHYFTASYSGDRLGSVKPSPKSFARVAEDFKIEPRQLLHIGDRRDTDSVAAGNAGARCLILGRDFVSFDVLATLLRE